MWHIVCVCVCVCMCVCVCVCMCVCCVHAASLAWDCGTYLAACGQGNAFFLCLIVVHGAGHDWALKVGNDNVCSLKEWFGVPKHVFAWVFRRIELLSNVPRKRDVADKAELHSWVPVAGWLP